MTRLKNKDVCRPHRNVTSVSKVKVCEHGKSAVFKNPDKNEYHVVRVDGGLVENACSADYAISRPNIGNLIVELKGKEVGRACEQVLATVEILRQCTKRTEPVAGLVVCTRRPATDTKSMRLQNVFLNKHKLRLRICASNSEYNFEEFFKKK